VKADLVPCRFVIFEWPVLCRFSDAGMSNLSTRSCGRRPKSAKT
jgi:hypothetical protein